MPEDNNIPTLEEVESSLEDIDRILHQMLLLAGLSASDSNVQRESLQKVLDRLRDRIDSIADRLSPPDPHPGSDEKAP